MVIWSNKCSSRTWSGRSWHRRPCACAARCRPVIGQLSRLQNVKILSTYLLQIVKVLRRDLDRVGADDVLDVGRVNRDLGATHDLDLLADPRNKRKLDALRVVVIAVGHPGETKRGLGRVQLGGELVEVAGAGLRENQLVGPVRLGCQLQNSREIGILDQLNAYHAKPRSTLLHTS